MADRGARCLCGSEGDGPETGEDVPPVTHEEIAPRAPHKARTGRPAAALQHLLRPKIRLRVLFVRVTLEARVRLEGVGHPFPDVADHLAAAEGAVASGQ